MSITINNISVVSGMTVRLKSLNTYDNKVWEGEVIGADLNSEMAGMVSDITKYHQEVLIDLPNIGALNTQKFLILQLTSPGDEGKKVAFAVNWINPADFESLSVNTHRDIRVSNVSDAEALEVISLLAQGGFNATLLD